MMLEPDITVRCDKCNFEEKFDLTSGEFNKKTDITEYDNSNVEEDMKSVGWAKIDKQDICPSCKKLLGIIPTIDRPVLEVDETA